LLSNAMAVAAVKKIIMTHFSANFVRAWYSRGICVRSAHLTRVMRESHANDARTSCGSPPWNVLQRGPKVTSFVARGRCAQHLRDTRATWRTSYANVVRYICVTYAPGSRRVTPLRESDANVARTCRARSAQQGTLLLNPLYYLCVPSTLHRRMERTPFAIHFVHIRSIFLAFNIQRAGVPGELWQKGRQFAG
jgi:hypothetical protein